MRRLSSSSSLLPVARDASPLRRGLDPVSRNLVTTGRAGPRRGGARQPRQNTSMARDFGSQFLLRYIATGVVNGAPYGLSWEA